MFAYTAPEPGTGKTLRIQVDHLLAEVARLLKEAKNEKGSSSESAIPCPSSSLSTSEITGRSRCRSLDRISRSLALPVLEVEETLAQHLVDGHPREVRHVRTIASCAPVTRSPVGSGCGCVWTWRRSGVESENRAETRYRHEDLGILDSTSILSGSGGLLRAPYVAASWDRLKLLVAPDFALRFEADYGLR